MDIDNNINALLGISDVVMDAVVSSDQSRSQIIVKKTEPLSGCVVDHDAMIADDLEVARRNVRSIIEAGTAALDEMIEVAKQTESARDYEVVSNLITAMVNANKDLLRLQKQAKDLRTEKRQEPTTASGQVPGTTINAVFVGTTDELQRIVKQRRNEHDQDNLRRVHEGVRSDASDAVIDGTGDPIVPTETTV